MSATSTTSPSNQTSLSSVVRAVWHGVWTEATTSPIVGVLLLVALLAIAVRVYRFFRWLPITAASRDPQRRFAGVDRQTIMLRAGGRCEFHGLLGRRCTVADKLQADHIHPHSRGGSTTVGNGQALCSRHNKQKAARIPFEWELRRIAKHRSAYYPGGISGTVMRRLELEHQQPQAFRQSP